MGSLESIFSSILFLLPSISFYHFFFVLYRLFFLKWFEFSGFLFRSLNSVLLHSFTRSSSFILPVRFSVILPFSHLWRRNCFFFSCTFSKICVFFFFVLFVLFTSSVFPCYCCRLENRFVCERQRSLGRGPWEGEVKSEGMGKEREGKERKGTERKGKRGACKWKGKGRLKCRQ